MKMGSLTARVAASALVLLGVLAFARDGAQAQPADTTPPVFVSATTDGASIVITFSEDILVSPLLSYVQEFSGEPLSLFLKAVFTVTIDGHDVWVADNNFISGSEVTLQLAYYPGSDDTVRVSARSPARAFTAAPRRRRRRRRGRRSLSGCSARPSPGWPSGRPAESRGWPSRPG